MNYGGDLAHLLPLHARDRVEVDAQPVGMVEVFGTYRVRVQLEAGEVRHPGERRGIARHHLVGRAARGEAQLDHLDPLGAHLRRALLIEELAVDPVRVAHQHVGPAAGAAQGALRYREVVAHEVELGVLRLRKENLGGIRDRDLAAADLQDLALRAGGARRLRRRILWGSWWSARACTRSPAIRPAATARARAMAAARSAR